MTRFLLLFVSALAAAQMATNPLALVSEGATDTAAEKVAENIYRARGFGNTFLITTPEGNVVIDTSLAPNAPRHLKLLKAVSTAPVKYILLTHAHQDHTGGVRLWREPGTEVIAQREHAEFVHYLKRLEPAMSARAAAQFGLRLPAAAAEPWAGNYGAQLQTTMLFDQSYEFRLGGLTFRLLHTPGETPDHMTVFIPELKAVFTGDNYYESFPNLYTLRGTPPRPALAYVRSLNRVLDLAPELMCPSHGPPVKGAAEVRRRLTQYRDAILYVHDAVVKGVNDGRDVYALMRDVKLPPALDVGESYGKLTWSIRGIYEAYFGWFDLNPATMYESRPEAVYPDLVRLAGGADAVVRRARERLGQGQPVEALRLTDVALSADAGHKEALRTRMAALEALIAACRNTNERGWLDHAAAEVRRKLQVQE